MRSRRRRLQKHRKRQEVQYQRVAWESTWDSEEEYWDDDEDGDFDPDRNCHYCGGEGWGIVGTDWDCSDGINGPYNGEVEECPCCHGSGDADDCTFW